MGKIIVFTSGRGGTGKTTVAVNVSYCLEKSGCKVLLIDGDYTYGDLDLHLKMSEQIVYHMQDIIDGNCRIIEALYATGDKGNIFLLAAPHKKEVSRLTAAQVKKLMGLFAAQFDYVIVDLPSPVSETEMAYLASADSVVLVEKPETMNVRAVNLLRSFLPEGVEEKLSLIVNFVRKDLQKYKEQMVTPDFVSMLKLPFICSIPDDDDILVGTSHGEAVFDIHSAACKAFTEAAEKLMEVE